MDRISVVQPILDLFEDPKYLEIGVNRGTTFQAVRARQKVAVDPQFLFDYKSLDTEENTQYHQTTSDFYFSDIKSEKQEFDVIYVDGLHTFDQTLRDVQNALCCLSDAGVIIIDDVIPPSYAASLLDFEQKAQFLAKTGGQEDSWMGDVYRLVFFIRDYLPAFTYATVAESHGILVMWKDWGRPAPGRPLGVEAISRLDYGLAMIAMDDFRKASLDNIISDLRAWHSER